MKHLLISPKFHPLEATHTPPVHAGWTPADIEPSSPARNHSLLVERPYSNSTTRPMPGIPCRQLNVCEHKGPPNFSRLIQTQIQRKYIGVEGIRTQTLKINFLPSKVLRLDPRIALRPIYLVCRSWAWSALNITSYSYSPHLQRLSGTGQAVELFHIL